MNYCRSLKFEEKPDIGYLRKLFKDLFYRMGYEYDFVFDWMVKKSGQNGQVKIGGGTGQADEDNKDNDDNDKGMNEGMNQPQ